MNGAESLLTTLLNQGVDVCFANPGTSEMHFVAALDEVPGMRCVLALFEGVASGAADGYARMARRPAATLLHLGPGFGNALANVHNAKKGNVPMVNIVGDHATYHLQYDAPLTSDIAGIAGPVSHWVHSSEAPERIALDTAEAVRQAGRNRVATLMLPADVSWGENPNGPVAAQPAEPPASVPASRVEQALQLLRGGRNCMILVGGMEIDRQRGLMLSRIGRACGARVATEVFVPRIARGADTAVLERIPYLAEFAIDSLKEVEHLILIGAGPPVSFFAYPDLPSRLAPENCSVLELATVDEDIDQLLETLLEKLDAVDVEPEVHRLAIQELPPAGPLDSATAVQVIAHYLPENAILVDESATSGLTLPLVTATAQPHDALTITGGSIGWGLPAAVGAAVACPERKVIALEGDGSAMYTIQALWTMAREKLDVTVVVFSNRRYSILDLEYARTGARGGVPGPSASGVLGIGAPDLDFVALAEGMGVEAARAQTVEDFAALVEQAMQARGPRLIDAVVPPLA